MGGGMPMGMGGGMGGGMPMGMGMGGGGMMGGMGPGKTADSMIIGWRPPAGAAPSESGGGQ